MIPFEEQNAKTYKLILRIENILREFITRSLKEEFDSRWQREIPGDCKKRIKEASGYEASQHFQFRKMGPLYYLTLGDMEVLLKQKVGGKAREGLGGSPSLDNDTLMPKVREALPVRNALAHSRDVTGLGQKSVTNLYDHIVNALGEDTVRELLANPDIGISQEDAAEGLLQWLCENREALSAEADLPDQDSVYEKASEQYWWGQAEYGGFENETIDEVVDLLEKYRNLPKGIGTITEKQHFISDSELLKKLNRAVKELEEFKHDK
jgi:hypothetical protein